MMVNKQKGFTLFEVMISMFIAAVAVLGLVMLELTILRSSQSSFNYTLATIEANTLADKVWMDLCNIKSSDPDAVFESLYSDWKSDLADPDSNSTVFTGDLETGNSENFLLNDAIEVSWTDKNFASDADTAVDEANDRAVLNVSYQDFTELCL